MNKNTLNIGLILLFVLAFIGFNSLYVVTEGTKGIVTRFGKVVRASDGKLEIVEPGLHFKAPFIDQVKALDVKTRGEILGAMNAEKAAKLVKIMEPQG